MTIMVMREEFMEEWWCDVARNKAIQVEFMCIMFVWIVSNEYEHALLIRKWETATLDKVEDRLLINLCCNRSIFCHPTQNVYGK